MNVHGHMNDDLTSLVVIWCNWTIFYHFWIEVLVYVLQEGDTNCRTGYACTLGLIWLHTKISPFPLSHLGLISVCVAILYYVTVRRGIHQLHLVGLAPRCHRYTKHVVIDVDDWWIRSQFMSNLSLVLGCSITQGTFCVCHVLRVKNYRKPKIEGKVAHFMWYVAEWYSVIFDFTIVLGPVFWVLLCITHLYSAVCSIT